MYFEALLPKKTYIWDITDLGKEIVKSVDELVRSIKPK
jgi:hypothetical protein